MVRPLFELDSETIPTGQPCRPPSLRHRPRRVRPARLAQETEEYRRSLIAIHIVDEKDRRSGGLSVLGNAQDGLPRRP